MRSNSRPHSDARKSGARGWRGTLDVREENRGFARARLRPSWLRRRLPSSRNIYGCGWRDAQRL